MNKKSKEMNEKFPFQFFQSEVTIKHTILGLKMNTSIGNPIS
jgi:hypothetical protein